MKTKEQILKWLDEQPWANEFYKAAFFNRKSQISYDEYFIAEVFDWFTAESDASIWSERDKEFLKWYTSNDKPLSWKEYCEQNPIKADEYFISENCKVETLGDRFRDSDTDVNVMPKDLCEAFLAYMKLIQLRNAWVKDCDKTTFCCKIKSEKDRITGVVCPYFENGLSFPTRAMADEFIKTFKDLLEVAKPLL